MKFFKFIGISIMFLAMGLTLFLTTFTEATNTPLLFVSVLTHFLNDTNAPNAVASIYLNYRVFDTLFEALMLLISVISVIHFSRHVGTTYETESKRSIISNFDEKITQKGFIYLIVPVVILVGIYIILNGHASPGGGFQGGAALTASVICVYLVRPNKTISFYKYERLEKYIFILIITIPMVFSVSNLYLSYTEFNIFYLLVMNILIGAKVFLGLSVIFFRFVHYEDR